MSEYNEQTVEEQLIENEEQPILVEKPHKKTASPIKIGLISGIAGSLLGASLIMGGLYIQQATTRPTQQPANITSVTKTVSSPKAETSITSAIEKVQGAIVSIAKYQSNTENNLFGLSGASNGLQKAGEGSGVIYKVSGDTAYIVTNNHVIENAQELEVLLKNGKTVQAELVGTDKLTDLAVLKIQSSDVSTTASFANSDELKVGETALAIGSPLGSKLASTVTKGIISAVNRSVDIDTNGDKQPDWTMETIQTDAAINPGNSGGALVDENGNVIGINSMKISDTSVEGIGFAIPSNQVVKIIEELENKGKISRPYLGVGLVDMTDVSTTQRKRLLSLPENVTEGVVISQVQENSSADNAGLKQYDVIIKWNGEDIKNAVSLRKHLYSHAIGEKVTLDVYRNGKLEKVTVTLTTNQNMN
ncbi:trypsin-like peptidase domain-containing protein [Carnobacteriaceae bacterium zg-84]|uniref:S1C family serine protease n=1 Tax=Granulicatella sp. zg-84 TaxID=2678503 RepID=UPI0013BFB3CE|nr:trypsin-like peptidase domain-containing protein [Granulicatella sp. zg-84]NEW66392.1 PDZ domain-containing protein [Granulicatella sp. zg-84]QMI86142.1 trypsin-like peptidase domain-containing protein [Carnobacteriaceae bacterium zg-84]